MIKTAESTMYKVGPCNLICKFEEGKAEYMLTSIATGWSNSFFATGELHDLKELAVELVKVIDHIERGQSLDFWKVR